MDEVGEAEAAANRRCVHDQAHLPVLAALVLPAADRRRSHGAAPELVPQSRQSAPRSRTQQARRHCRRRAIPHRSRYGTRPLQRAAAARGRARAALRALLTRRYRRRNDRSGQWPQRRRWRPSFLTKAPAAVVCRRLVEDRYRVSQYYDRARSPLAMEHAATIHTRDPHMQTYTDRYKDCTK